MTEYGFPNTNSTTKKNKFCDFSIIFSFILSYPLYFSYLIFFSPYLLKLLCFLSPLFFTISLLFLALLTTLIPLHSINYKEGSFLLSAYNTLLEKLHPKFDDLDGNLEQIEEFEVYKIVFEIPIIEVMEENPDEREISEVNPIEFSEEKVSQEEKTGDKNPNKLGENVREQESVLTRIGSEKIGSNKVLLPKVKDSSLKVDDEKKLCEAFSQTVGSTQYLGSFGSMRKEKEWRRTLACKLFEERHNGVNNNTINGATSEEGMDLLWETYETESNKGRSKEDETKNKRKKKIENVMMMVVNDNDNDDDDDDDVDDDYGDDNGKICCLQALKLSAGKMNLSMGRPNLIKISKAFKGIGWLQSHVSRRQGKKGYK